MIGSDGRGSFLASANETARHAIIEDSAQTASGDRRLSSTTGPETDIISEARNVSKSFGEDGRMRLVLRDVSLAVRSGEVAAVLGPSGCGKSTLLRILTGLIPFTEGEVLCHGRPLQGFHPGAAIVFQSFALYPWLTVAENVRVGLYRRGLTAQEELSRIRHAIDLVGLGGFEAFRGRRAPAHRNRPRNPRGEGC